MTPSEQFVYQICKRSFLSVWSYPNPKGKKGKELCDILVVCEPDIIIFSVKEIQASDTGDYEVDMQRWIKSAVEKSVNQIYGAERWIETATNVTLSDGSTGLLFPSSDKKRVHRISVSLGGERRFPLAFGDFGKGHVHIFDEVSFGLVLSELNTISDFIEYLVAQESISSALVVNGGQENLLAYYLLNERAFHKVDGLIIVEDDLWAGYISEKQYSAKIAADKISYVWDNVIEVVGQDVLSNNLEYGSTLDNNALAIRAMARESRFNRRILGHQFFLFLEQKTSRSRICPSPSGIVYVFLTTYDEEPKYIFAELTGRCFVARGIINDATIIVGIAVQQSKVKKGYALTLVFLEKPAWTQEDEKEVQFLQGNLGYFKNAITTKIHEDEYPKT